MKKSPLPRRRSYITRSPLPRGGIRRSNPARKAKKAARYKAFLSSAVWKRIRKAALERAGHQCEGEQEYMACNNHGIGICMTSARCWETEKLTVHHKTYARFGGKELPEDLEVRCKSCHDYHHALEGKRIA